MALARDFHRQYKPNAGGLTTRRVPVKGAVADTLYKGAILAVDVSDADGFAQPYVAALTAATGDFIPGIAMERVTTTAADANGDKEILVATDGVWAFPIGSVTAANLGDAVYADQDDAVTLTAGTELQLGVVAGVDTVEALVWVDISKHTFVRA